MAKLGWKSNEQNEEALDKHSHASKRSSFHSMMSSQDRLKPGAIEYLARGREQRESTKDFVAHTRSILAAQIAISDKSEETERLKEYIVMEREKLEEARKTFEEDKDKFTKYMEDLKRKSDETDETVQKCLHEKN